MLAELESVGSNRIILTTEFRHKELAKSLPGARFTNSGNSYESRWHVPLSWATCLALRSTFGEDLEIGPDLTAWAANEMETRINPCLELRFALDAPGDSSLFPFQRAGVQFLATARRALLCDEMGSGKTRQAAATLMELYRRGENPFPALVVCPNTTKIGWKREIETVWPGLKVNVVKGSAVERRKLLEDKAHIYIINWESLRAHSRLAPYGSIALKKCPEHGGTDESINEARCEVHPRELNAIDFKSVIGDEIHRAKDPAAKQTRAFWSATGDAPIRIGMTGTPIANSPDELWTALHWISPEEWPSKVKFIDRMCDVSFNAWGAAKVIGIKRTMEEEFFKAFDPRMRRMPKELVLPFLPPILFERRDVDMNPKQAKAYEQMREQMAAELDDGDIIFTTNPMVKMTRLLQFSSAFAEIEQTDDDSIKIRLSDPSCKLDAFIEDLPDYGDASIVVFAVSRQLIEMLSARMTKLGLEHGLITGAINEDERQRHMDDFQAGRTRFILCTTGAGGTGITLTKGRVAVFLQRSWSMIENAQAEGRVHRIGSEQHENITIVDYVSTGTVEETVIDAVAEKGDRLEEILRDKQLLARLLNKPITAKRKTTPRKKAQQPEELTVADATI